VPAARLGYPVALRSADPDVVHKSDRNGVRLNLRNESGVRAAFHTVQSCGRPESGVVVQAMVTATTELAVGVLHDSLFGSLLMAGLGGVHTDVLADRVFRLDLNPVMAGPDGVTVVDVKMRLHPAGVEPDPTLRQLRWT